MSKRLPYFQFEPAEWLAGDIMFCSLSAQGLFTTLKALYWQKDCDLTLEQAIKRLQNKEVFDELILEKIIKIKEGKIKINFLDQQYEKASVKSQVNSKNGALGGRPKKPVESENKPNGFNSVSKNESEKKPIREDKIREDKIREKKVDIEDRKLKFSHTLDTFKNEYGEEMILAFFNYWSEPNQQQTKMRFEMQKTWSVKGRLTTWAKNEEKFQKEKGSAQKEKVIPIIGRASQETILKNATGWET